MRLLTGLLFILTLLGLSNSVYAQCTTTIQYNNTGNTFTFTPVLLNNNFIYSWTISDRNNGSSTNYHAIGSLTHTFSGVPDLGHHNINLIVQDTISGCSYSVHDTIIHQDPSNPCSMTNVSFQYTRTLSNIQVTAIVTGFSPTNYIWTLYPYSPSPIYDYGQTTHLSLSGLQVFCLDISDSVCHRNLCVRVDPDTINPCYNFNPSIFNYHLGAGGAVHFNLASLGPNQPMGATWDFGDGSSPVNNVFNPTHTYTNNGIYRACVTTDSNSCSYTHCDRVLVGSASNPTSNACQGLNVSINISQDANNPFLLWMQPVVNNANPNSFYDFDWNFGDGTGNSSGYPAHTYDNFGSYEVCLFTIDSANSCAASICDTITLDSLGNFSRNTSHQGQHSGFQVNTLPAQINVNTNIQSMNDTDSWKWQVFPNPTINTVTLELNTPEAIDGVICILNTTGQVVYTQVIEQVQGSQQWTLSTSDLPVGIYLVELTSNTSQRVLKLIKQ